MLGKPDPLECITQDRDCRTGIAGHGWQDMDGRTWTGLLILKTFGIALS